MIHVIATSHGTDNVQGRESIDLIRGQLAEALESEFPGRYQIHEAYVDVQAPALDDVVTEFSSDDEVIIVPLLLSTGFHTQVDMQKAADACPATVRIAAALGPSAALAKLQRTRLEEVGYLGGEPLVMAAAGSSRPDGREAVALQSEVLSTLLSNFTPHGFVAKIDPKIGDVVAEHAPEFISSYLMAPGFFQNLLHKLDGASEDFSVAEPLVVPGDTDAAAIVAGVAAQRLQEALAS
ncbi:sirohydrochlorin chelatase [Rothia sp. ZJ1223]|uniref:sirohydrochlorin chelatase n=1 Tax=Rothia sp. ZJ1223 TaxID=2811098 RepID=UPI00195DD84A|nr:CbiX/SirB N-terminal domain-containing protein [Rothia sp. ZJ1223]MBM7050865.1 CMP-binding protein [Rothia sp. ZJ1223]